MIATVEADETGGVAVAGVESSVWIGAPVSFVGIGDTVGSDPVVPFGDPSVLGGGVSRPLVGAAVGAPLSVICGSVVFVGAVVVVCDGRNVEDRLVDGDVESEGSMLRDRDSVVSGVTTAMPSSRSKKGSSSGRMGTPGWCCSCSARTSNRMGKLAGPVPSWHTNGSWNPAVFFR